MSKIEMGKEYETLDGCEVEIFAIKDGRVWGREKRGGEWVCNSWHTANTAPYLREVKPTITRTEWAVRYTDKVCVDDERSRDVVGVLFANREAAEKFMISRSVRDSVAAITGPHTITFTEGEGL